MKPFMHFVSLGFYLAALAAGIMGAEVRTLIILFGAACWIGIAAGWENE